MVGKRVFRVWLIVAGLVAFSGASIHADDTDIYTNENGGVEPNVLIIFDNSGSMNDPMPDATYDPLTAYPGTYAADTVYYRWRSS